MALLVPSPLPFHQPNNEQLLERRLERVLVQCGFRATEQAGLAALRDFIVSGIAVQGMRWPCCTGCGGAGVQQPRALRMWPLAPPVPSTALPLQAVHGAFVSLFLAQSQGTPYGSLVASIAAAASGSQPATAAGQALVPLNRQTAGQAPTCTAGCAAPPAEGRSRPAGFISRLRPPIRE